MINFNISVEQLTTLFSNSLIDDTLLKKSLSEFSKEELVNYIVKTLNEFPEDTEDEEDQDNEINI